MFEPDFRVDGSVDRAMAESTNALVRDGWRIRERRYGSIWLDHQFPGWTGSAQLGSFTSSDKTKASAQLSITLAASSSKQCATPSGP
jgi:hypothetical protein